MTVSIFEDHFNGMSLYLPPRLERWERGDEYIYFSPTAHVWVIVNKFGGRIIEALRNNPNIKDVLDDLVEGYHPLDEQNQLFYSILSFITQLHEINFLREKPDFPTIDIEKIKKDLPLKLKQMEENYQKEGAITTLFLSMTDKCNLNCIYCYNSDSRKKNLSRCNKQLNYTEIISILVPPEKLILGS